MNLSASFVLQHGVSTYVAAVFSFMKLAQFCVSVSYSVRIIAFDDWQKRSVTYLMPAVLQLFIWRD
jgi:hypothetical protein